MDTHFDKQRHLTKRERKLLRHEEKMRMRDEMQKHTFFQNWLVWGGITVVIVIVGGWVFFASQKSNTEQSYIPASTSIHTQDSATFVKDRLSHATLNLSNNETWQPNAADLPRLMEVLHLPPSDPSYLHHHDHLDIYIHGHKITVPAQIGLSQVAELPTHTHDPSGIIHVETSDTTFKSTLGLFFDIWGVSFTEKNIGGYTADETNKLTVFVNGKQYQGDPRQLPLNQHDEIVVAYGQESELPQPIPASAEFPNGL